MQLVYNLQITHMEMIKGIQGHGYYDELVVPIIENTAYEYELTQSLAIAVCSICSFDPTEWLYYHGNVRLMSCM